MEGPRHDPMNQSATLVGVIKSAEACPDHGAEAAVVENGHWIERRADLSPDLEAAELRQRFRGLKLLYTFRRHSGPRVDPESLADRHRRLRSAAMEYDLVTLEGECDLVPEVLEAIAPERRVVSWHGPATAAASLDRRLHDFGRTPARLYRFEVECATVEDGLVALQFLRRAQRRDVTAYGDGAGSWTRPLAPRLGAPIAFGAVASGSEATAVELTIQSLVTDYGFPGLYPVREIFGIVGPLATSSLSPRLHNGAYRAATSGRLYLSFPVSDFQPFWERLVLDRAMETLGLPIGGLTISSPHKESALAAASLVSPLCRQGGASNLLVRGPDQWTALTTDPDGLFQHPALAAPRPGARVAVIGCGGSGRICAAALREAGAEVTLVNRGVERGRWAARLLGLPFVPLECFSAAGYGGLVNATPLGRHGENLPVGLAELDPAAAVVDLVYRRGGGTPLAEQARALGHRVVDGPQVLLAQIRRQYHVMTGETMSSSLGSRLLGLPHTKARRDPGARDSDSSDARRLLVLSGEGGLLAE